LQEDKDKPGPQRLAELREAIRRRAEADREARRAAETLRVARLQELPASLWIVMGRGGDYVVVEDSFCSCPHFTIKVMGGETVEPCYHLVAVRVAADTGRYHDLSRTLTPGEVQGIVAEALYAGRSATLRRRLYGLDRGVEDAT